MNTDIVLQVTGMSIRRDGAPILQDIEWTMLRGQHWVILGSNGSGKTSLLKALTGYMTPSSGDIVLLGEEFGNSDWRELRKRVGVVSASLTHLFHDEDDALEIVAGGKEAMVGYWGEVPGADLRKARRLLGLLKAGQLAGRRWEVLSQGERQRVLIARALMANPAVLILDEPCAGLDPVARERFLEDVRELAIQGTGPGMVFVTHHVEEILPEFTHLLMLKKGKIAYSGPIKAGLKSAALSDVFSAPLRLSQRGQRYVLSVLRSDA